jgi:ureidoacrylate peracid hydrolase
MPLRPQPCARNGIARRRIGGKNMANLKFAKEITALLVIDPYNDFISEGGKVWERLKTVAEANDCSPRQRKVSGHAIDS